jgi:hypothetical protein
MKKCVVEALAHRHTIPGIRITTNVHNNIMNRINSRNTRSVSVSCFSLRTANSGLFLCSLNFLTKLSQFLDIPVLSSVSHATYVKILKFKFLKC